MKRRAGLFGAILIVAAFAVPVAVAAGGNFRASQF